MKCVVMAEADGSRFGEREPRLYGILDVLRQLGWEPAVCGPKHPLVQVELGNAKRAENLETQMGAADGWRADYRSKFMTHLHQHEKDYKLIVATEAWHQTCFRGLSERLYRGIPLVEFGIDYPGSFAVLRVFFSRWAMASAAGAARWNEHWIYTPPPGVALEPVPPRINSFDENSGAFSLNHLYDGLKGVAAVAPDWGIWAETVVPGKTGFLYRTKEGREKAEKNAAQLVPGDIAEHLRTKYPAAATVAWCKGFMATLHG